MMELLLQAVGVRVAGVCKIQKEVASSLNVQLIVMFSLDNDGAL